MPYSLRGLRAVWQEPEGPFHLDERPAGIAGRFAVADEGNEIGAHRGVRQEVAVPDEAPAALRGDEVDDASDVRHGLHFARIRVGVEQSEPELAPEQGLREAQRSVACGGVDSKMQLAGVQDAASLRRTAGRSGLV